MKFEYEAEHLLEKLRISEQQFRGAFEHAAVGMAIVALNGQWIEVNSCLSAMLGYRSEELLACTFQELTHPEDLNKDLAAVNRLIKGDKDSYKMEKRYFHKNGQVIYAILSVSIVRDQHNAPLHFVSQIIDITHLKEAEDRLEMVLEVTNDQNERLLNYAHIVSHNLRSHSGNLSMLLNFLKEEGEEHSRKELLQMVHDAASSLGETISHLSEVVSMHQTAQDSLKPVGLKSVVNKALTNVKALLRQVDGTCMNEVEDHHVVKVIPAYMDSIILNLLTNAIKYRCLERKLLVRVTAKCDLGFVVLSVSDNGTGIDLKRNGGQIFGMYKTFHDHADARGIGLFITKNQVEAMGGKIMVESICHVGAVFRVHLKMVEG